MRENVRKAVKEFEAAKAASELAEIRARQALEEMATAATRLTGAIVDSMGSHGKVASGKTLYSVFRTNMGDFALRSEACEIEVMDQESPHNSTLDEPLDEAHSRPELPPMSSRNGVGNPLAPAGHDI